MTDHVIIDAAQRFSRKPMPPGVDPQWTRTSDETRAMFCPSLKALPFVSAEWANEYWPEKMWADIPTNDYHADRERGKEFAKMTLGAMMADKPAHGRALEMIFESIVEDAIKRRAKGGKGSRRMPAAVSGYLEGLANYITGSYLRDDRPAS